MNKNHIVLAVIALLVILGGIGIYKLNSNTLLQKTSEDIAILDSTTKDINDNAFDNTTLDDIETTSADIDLETDLKTLDNLDTATGTNVYADVDLNDLK